MHLIVVWFIRVLARGISTTQVSLLLTADLWDCLDRCRSFQRFPNDLFNLATPKRLFLEGVKDLSLTYKKRRYFGGFHFSLKNPLFKSNLSFQARQLFYTWVERRVKVPTIVEIMNPATACNAVISWKRNVNDFGLNGYYFFFRKLYYVPLVK